MAIWLPVSLCSPEKKRRTELMRKKRGAEGEQGGPTSRLNRVQKRSHPSVLISDETARTPDDIAPSLVRCNS